MKRNNEYYKAKAIVRVDGGKRVTVTIFSHYETKEEANEGIERFVELGYDIVKAWVE